MVLCVALRVAYIPQAVLSCLRFAEEESMGTCQGLHNSPSRANEGCQRQCTPLIPVCKALVK